jgi:Ca-activated chloride channel family protein
MALSTQGPAGVRGALLAGATLLALGAALVGWGGRDAFLTPDQQGRAAYERGETALAAQRFENPRWKAQATYASGDFPTAAVLFGALGGPEGAFGRGNALAHAGSLKEALDAYDEALSMRPDFPEATANRRWVEGLYELSQKEYDDAGGTGGKLGADGIVFDDRAAKAKGTMTSAEAAAQGLSDAELEAIWMRRVQTTPGDFLRLKFASELYSAPSPGGGAP